MNAAYRRMEIVSILVVSGHITARSDEQKSREATVRDKVAAQTKVQ